MDTRTYNTGDGFFDLVFVNSLNGRDVSTLTPDELAAHEQYVNDNWDELNK